MASLPLLAFRHSQILLLRALAGLGDLLCMIPACRALRAAQPQARVELVGLPWARAIVARFPRYLDGLVEFPGYPGIPESPMTERSLAGLEAIRARQVDLVIQMHGSGTISNPLAELLGGRRTAGCFLPGEYCPDRETFLPYPASPEPVRLVELVEFLGAPRRGLELEFPVSEADHAELGALAEAATIAKRPYVCVHPGSSTRASRWPADRFARVADEIASKGFAVVLTGTAAEADLCKAVQATMARPAIPLAGKTSLGAMASLLSGARLLVCNDTGVSHLAAALRVPSVVVFTGSDPTRWAPIDRTLHRAVGHRVRAINRSASMPRGGRPAARGPGRALEALDRSTRWSPARPDIVVAAADDLLRRIPAVTAPERSGS
jgi:ADP-heptose:LPS heptosyltransferase